MRQSDYLILAVEDGDVIDCGGTSSPKTRDHEVASLVAMGLPVKVRHLLSGESTYHPSQEAWNQALNPKPCFHGATRS